MTNDNPLTAAHNNTNLRGFCKLYGHDLTSAGICRRCNKQA